jgi:hypothetical protein
MGFGVMWRGGCARKAFSACACVSMCSEVFVFWTYTLISHKCHCLLFSLVL